MRRAEDAVGLRAQPLDGAARALVALVGLDGHPVALPGLEGMPEQQELRLGVDGRPLRPRREPGVANLAGVEHVLSGPRILAVGPLPALQIEEARAANDLRSPADG